MLFDEISSKNSAQQVMEEVISLVEEEGFSAGEKIPSEKELMEYLDFGRSTIREALHALVAIGVLESRPGKGYFVRQYHKIPLYSNEFLSRIMDDDSFFDLMESRKIVERSIFMIAAERATDEDIENIESSLARLKEALEADRDNITNLTTDVHFAIASATHNQILVGLLEQLSPIIAEKIEGTSIPPREDYDIHRQLVEGIKSGDPDQAEDAILKHLERMKERYLDHLQEETQNGFQDGNPSVN
jgi:GntR family transcriptional repressor for pyruvate dehydrogenase complex